MKILALSDHVIEAIHSVEIRERYADVDVVIACGDLPYYYLEFVSTVLSVPLVYVHGNHDRTQHMSDGRSISAPEGCISLEDRVTRIGGLTLAGLGGSMRYNAETPHQYTEGTMRLRIAGLLPKLIRNQLGSGRFLDILVTHSPPFGIHDGKDLPHTGFKSFLWLMRVFQPRLLLHGHTHHYRNEPLPETRYFETRIINVYPSRVIELDTHV